jgi:hypothetical protein
MRQCSGAVLEAPALVAGFDDVAMMGEAVEQPACALAPARNAKDRSRLAACEAASMLGHDPPVFHA